MKIKYILFGIVFVSFMGLQAQELQEKISLTTRGRILLDAATFKVNDNSKEPIYGGVAMPDARIGLKGSFRDWGVKIDIGYANAKVSLKDVYIDKNFSKNSFLKLGYFVHHFGLQSGTSSSMKITSEEPATNEAFFAPRLLGAMFLYQKDKFLGTFSLFSENETIKQTADKLGDISYGGMTRLLYRPFTQEGKILHMGMSFAYEEPQYKGVKGEDAYGKETTLPTHDTYRMKAPYPSRVSKFSAIEITVPNVESNFRFTPEVLWAHKGIAVEAQYFDVTLNRKDGFKNYHASGAYGLVRGLLKGKQYKYNFIDSGIATPGEGYLEWVVGYNYTDLNDQGLNGGRMSDYVLGFNYYINRYMIWRIRYSYTDVSGINSKPNTYLHTLSTRLQILF